MKTTQERYNEIIGKFSNNRFWRLLELEFVKLDQEEAYIKTHFKDELTNVKGSLHGGVILSMLDIVMGAIGLAQGGKEILVLQLETRFLKQILDGEVHGIAKIKHSTNSTLIIEGIIKDDQGSLVAMSTGTFKAFS